MDHREMSRMTEYAPFTSHFAKVIELQTLLEELRVAFKMVGI
jgi:hypothetical protein